MRTLYPFAARILEAPFTKFGEVILVNFFEHRLVLDSTGRQRAGRDNGDIGTAISNVNEIGILFSRLEVNI